MAVATSDNGFHVTPLTNGRRCGDWGRGPSGFGLIAYAGRDLRGLRHRIGWRSARPRSRVTFGCRRSSIRVIRGGAAIRGFGRVQSTLSRAMAVPGPGKAPPRVFSTTEAPRRHPMARGGGRAREARRRASVGISRLRRAGQGRPAPSGGGTASTSQCRPPRGRLQEGL